MPPLAAPPTTIMPFLRIPILSLMPLLIPAAALSQARAVAADSQLTLMPLGVAHLVLVVVGRQTIKVILRYLLIWYFVRRIDRWVMLSRLVP